MTRRRVKPVGFLDWMIGSMPARERYQKARSHRDSKLVPTDPVLRWLQNSSTAQKAGAGLKRPGKAGGSNLDGGAFSGYDTDNEYMNDGDGEGLSDIETDAATTLMNNHNKQRSSSERSTKHAEKVVVTKPDATDSENSEISKQTDADSTKVQTSGSENASAENSSLEAEFATTEDDMRSKWSDRSTSQSNNGETDIGFDHNKWTVDEGNKRPEKSKTKQTKTKEEAPNTYKGKDASERERMKQGDNIERQQEMSSGYRDVYGSLYPSQRCLQADAFFSQDDCKVLGNIEAKDRALWWHRLQQDYFNATGRMVPIEILKSKLGETA